jgi:hypothetical protein
MAAKPVERRVVSIWERSHEESMHDDGFHMIEVFHEQMKPLLSAPKSHPMGCCWRTHLIVQHWL